MEDIKVRKFFIQYTNGNIRYFTDFAKGSIEIREDGWIITTFERDIEYSDEFDYVYGFSHDVPKIETYEYQISPWEIQRVFFNRYDLLSLSEAKDDNTNEKQGIWNITIYSDEEIITLKGSNYPEPYGEQFFDGLKRLIKYKIVPDLP